MPDITALIDTKSKDGGRILRRDLAMLQVPSPLHWLNRRLGASYFAGQHPLNIYRPMSTHRKEDQEYRSVTSVSRRSLLENSARAEGQLRWSSQEKLRRGGNKRAQGSASLVLLCYETCRHRVVGEGSARKPGSES